MFTRALRRTDEEDSSAVALTEGWEEVDVRIGENVEDEDAVDAEGDATTFFFGTAVVAVEVDVALPISEKESGGVGGEKSDVSKNNIEVVLVFDIGAGSIARVSKKFAMKIPTQSAATIPRYDSKRFTYIR